jgi:hypothetical protein
LLAYVKSVTAARGTTDNKKNATIRRRRRLIPKRSLAHLTTGRGALPLPELASL